MIKKEDKSIEILKLLVNSGDIPLSGEEIANILGISRTAVWKHIKNLVQRGFKIAGQKNSGYKLLFPTDTPIILSSKNFQTNLFGKNILSFIEIDSTNNMAKKIAKEYPEGTIIISEKQTSGRGRRGRIWSSPFGSGLYFSVLLKPKLPIITIPRLTILAGVVVAKSLEKLGVNVKLKWPNDIILENKKIGGILSEMSLEGNDIEYVILGIGINVHTENMYFPEEFREKAGSIRSVSKKIIPRNILFKEIVIELERSYLDFCNKNGELGDIRKNWEERAYGLNEMVEITTGLEKEVCTILGLKDDGTLLVRDGSGVVKEVFAGEVLF